MIAYKIITVLTLHALLKSYAPQVNLDIERKGIIGIMNCTQVAYSNISNKSGDIAYDLLIVDEAQDIIGNDLWLDCLDLF